MCHLTIAKTKGKRWECNDEEFPSVRYLRRKEQNRTEKKRKKRKEKRRKGRRKVSSKTYPQTYQCKSVEDETECI